MLTKESNYLVVSVKITTTTALDVMQSPLRTDRLFVLECLCLSVSVVNTSPRFEFVRAV